VLSAALRRHCCRARAHARAGRRGRPGAPRSSPSGCSTGRRYPTGPLPNETVGIKAPESTSRGRPLVLRGGALPWWLLDRKGHPWPSYRSAATRCSGCRKVSSRPEIVPMGSVTKGYWNRPPNHPLELPSGFPNRRSRSKNPAKSSKTAATPPVSRAAAAGSAGFPAPSKRKPIDQGDAYIRQVAEIDRSFRPVGPEPQRTITTTAAGDRSSICPT
jgi:hypothetical protein